MQLFACTYMHETWSRYYTKPNCKGYVQCSFLCASACMRHGHITIQHQIAKECIQNANI